MSSKQDSVHLDYVDGLRGMAALYVLFSHAWMTVLPCSVNEYPVDGPRILKFFPDPHYAVTLFILISGFCLAIPVERGAPWSVREYFKKRAIRILPPYWITLALSILLITTIIGGKTGTPWDASVPVSWGGLLTHILLLHSITSFSHTINYPLWTISVEWHIYFLLPLILLSWKVFGRLASTVFLVALAWALSHALRHAPHLGDWPPQYIGVFAVGMLAAHYALASRDGTNLREKQSIMVWLAMGAYVILVLVTGKMGGFAEIRYARWFDLLATGAGFVLLVGLSHGRANAVTRICNWRPLVWVGGFSYSLYLVHAPLVQICYLAIRHLTPNSFLQFYLMVIVAIPLIVLAASGLYWGIERPFVLVLKHSARAPRLADLAPNRATP